MKPKAVLVNGLLWAFAALAAFPLVWMVCVSLMPAGSASSLPPPLLPHDPTLAHYRVLLGDGGLKRAFVNSLGLAVVSTLLSTSFNTLAGYAFAKLRFRHRERIFGLLIAALVIPGQVAMLPLFLMLKGMGLVNTWMGVLIPSLAGIFGIFLVRQYAQSIPDSILDAARIDGAGELRIFRSFVLVLCLPVLVTLGIFTFLGVWNDFLWPLIVLTDRDLYTLPVALANLVGEHVQDTELMMAGAVLTVLPVLVLFVALQRYYLAGIMAGSVKE